MTDDHTKNGVALQPQQTVSPVQRMVASMRTPTDAEVVMITLKEAISVLEETKRIELETAAATERERNQLTHTEHMAELAARSSGIIQEQRLRMLGTFAVSGVGITGAVLFYFFGKMDIVQTLVMCTITGILGMYSGVFQHVKDKK